MKNELWCVIECNCDGEIYDPDFFSSKEEAIEFLKHDANECYGQYLDFPEVQIRVNEEKLTAEVWTDEYSWVWRAFEVSTEVAKVL